MTTARTALHSGSWTPNDLVVDVLVQCMKPAVDLGGGLFAVPVAAGGKEAHTFTRKKGSRWYVLGGSPVGGPAVAALEVLDDGDVELAQAWWEVFEADLRAGVPGDLPRVVTELVASQPASQARLEVVLSMLALNADPVGAGERLDRHLELLGPLVSRVDTLRLAELSASGLFAELVAAAEQAESRATSVKLGREFKEAKAIALARGGDLEGAVTVTRSLHEAAPEDMQTRAALGGALRAAGRWQEAATLLEGHGRDSRVTNRLAWALVLTGREAEAVALIDATLAMTEDPGAGCCTPTPRHSPWRERWIELSRCGVRSCARPAIR